MYIDQTVPCKIIEFKDVKFYIIETQNDGWLNLNLYENRGKLSLTHCQGISNKDHSKHDSMVEVLKETIFHIQAGRLDD